MVSKNFRFPPDPPMPSKILILDFGSQYTQVIARRVRQLNVYSEIVRYDTPASVLKSLRPSGLILSGGPASVYAKGAPQPDRRIFDSGIPILGVCYGMQLFGKWLGGNVAPATGANTAAASSPWRKTRRSSRTCREKSTSGTATATA